MKYTGPTLPISIETAKAKHWDPGEDHTGMVNRLAGTLADSEHHRLQLKTILGGMYFLCGGRVENAIGSSFRTTTAFNCFVADTIHDSSKGIFKTLGDAAETMRLGGGIGYDFSTIRPEGDMISRVNAPASGPLSYMEVYNQMCRTIVSAGSRRGAMMGVLRIDHPDIAKFLVAKKAGSGYDLRQFNISAAVTDEFMTAVKEDKGFELKFGGKVYTTLRARTLWDTLMRSTYEANDPGVLFIDRINNKNNLSYCEYLAATNPCGEQPLPPHGACLLGSWNLTKFVKEDGTFDFVTFKSMIAPVVRMLDNVIENTTYPLLQQELEAQNKRRMGIGITGLGSALAMMGLRYSSPEARVFFADVLEVLRNEAYLASIDLAIEKGPFPAYDRSKYFNSAQAFWNRLPVDIQNRIYANGIRNSHLLSIAPTGTISLKADNVSSSLEPVFSRKYERKIIEGKGTKTEVVEDYAVARGFEVETTYEVSPADHVKMLAVGSEYVDSAVSKTINMPEDMSWEGHKDVYMQAYDQGASGCTTYRHKEGSDYVLKDVSEEGPVCEIINGVKSCE